MLSLAIAMESFQAVPRRGCQIAQFHSNVQLAQFSLRNPLNIPKTLAAESPIQLFRLGAAKRLDH
jgi:hypothetical protein